MAVTRTAPAINTVYERKMPDRSRNKVPDLNALARQIVDEPTGDAPAAPDQPVAISKLTHYRKGGSRSVWRRVSRREARL